MKRNLHRMNFGQVFTDCVTVRDRLRPLDKAKVKALAESMDTIGLQQPISVWLRDEEAVLVAGLHRYEAALSLGWDEIDCVFVALDEDERALWEIDENLIRAELNELERGQHLKRRKEIFERRHEKEQNKLTQKIDEALDAPPAKEAPPDNGQDQGGEIPSEARALGGAKRPTKKPQHEKGFDQDTADKTGLSKRTVRRSRIRADKIAADVADELSQAEPESSLGKQADSGTDLDALGTLDADEQRQAVDRVKSGADQNFRQARDFIKGQQPDEAAVQAQKEYESLCRAWQKAGADARARFVKNWVEDWTP